MSNSLNLIKKPYIPGLKHLLQKRLHSRNEILLFSVGSDQHLMSVLISWCIFSKMFLGRKEKSGALLRFLFS